MGFDEFVSVTLRCTEVVKLSFDKFVSVTIGTGTRYLNLIPIVIYLSLYDVVVDLNFLRIFISDTAMW